MGKSAFNKLAEQYIVTKNAVNKKSADSWRL